MSGSGHLTHSVGVAVLLSLIVRSLSRARTAGRCAALLPLRGKSRWHTANPILFYPVSPAAISGSSKPILKTLIFRSARCWSSRSGASTAPIFLKAVLPPSSPMAGKHPIEVGIIGREGMTGLSVLGNERPKHQTYMQAPGKALEKLSNGTYAPAVYN